MSGDSRWPAPTVILACCLLSGTAASRDAARLSLAGIGESRAALEQCRRDAGRGGIHCKLVEERSRSWGGVVLRRWQLSLRAGRLDFSRLEGCLRAGVILGPPVELSNSSSGQTLQAVAWTVERLVAARPAGAEELRQLEANLAWLRRLAGDSRPLLKIFSALGGVATVRLDRATLARRRLRLHGRAGNAAARATLLERLAEMARKLSWPLTLDDEHLLAGHDDCRCPGQGLVAAGVPAWLLLSAAAWLTGQNAVIAVAGPRLDYWQTGARSQKWFSLLARRAGFMLKKKHGIWRAGPQLRSRQLPAKLPPATVDLLFTGAPAALVLEVITEVAGGKLAVPTGVLPYLTAYVHNRLAEWAARACLEVLLSSGGSEKAQVARPEIASWDRPLAGPRVDLPRLSLLATFAATGIRAALFADGRGRLYLLRRGAVLGRQQGRLARVGRGRVCLELGRRGPLDVAELGLGLAPPAPNVERQP